MEKIKQFIESETGKNLLIVFIVILVGISSFELGRLSKNDQNSGIKVTYPVQPANVISAVDSSAITTNNTNTDTKPNLNVNIAGKSFFASNRGKKYYSIGCSGGKTIKQENRIYFNTETEAVNAGYAKSSSCK